MPDNLTIDGEALGTAAQSIQSASNEIPRGQAADIGNCQSNSVIAAIESFNVWANANSLIAQHNLYQSATDAKAAARTYGDWDESTGANVSARGGLTAY
ncbi:MAG TPA: hypothetical protein VN200_11285 [Rhodoglobus sp.]|nr:hypothetical protein [Rhodoglobus sp.]